MANLISLSTTQQAMEGYVEFYISCNPPLLPNGVSLVVTDLMEDLESVIIEVLYEPEVPWFKFITAVEHRLEVSRWMYSRLDKLLVAEAGAVDDKNSETGLDRPRSRSDIGLLTGKPHVISYPELKNTHNDALQGYEPFRYPEHLKSFAYKTVWRSLAPYEGVTVAKLLSKYEAFWPSSPASSSIEDLGGLTKCQISHNLQGSLLYIASNESRQALEAITRKLDTLASLMDAPLDTTSHLVFTECPKSTRLCYRWLTHTGLSKLTYVNPTTPEPEEVQEYSDIVGAVSLRIETFQSHGRPVPDSTLYPIMHRRSTESETEFLPFIGYRYGNKCPGTVATGKHKRTHPGSQPPYLEELDNKVNKLAKSKANSLSAGGLQASVTEFGGKTGGIDRTKRTVLKSHGEERQTSLQVDAVKEALELSNFASSNSNSSSDNRKVVYEWLGTVESEEDTKTTGSCPSMTDVKGNQDDVTNESPRPLPQAALYTFVPEEAPLIELEASPPRKEHGCPVVRSCVENLMDAPVDMPLIFSKHKDSLKDLYGTMRQQTAAPSWSKVASTKKSENEGEHQNFGRNIPVRVVTDNRAKTHGPEKKEPILSKKLHAFTPTNPNSRVVPGIDKPIWNQVDCSKITAQAETKLRELMEVIQMAPGRIIVKADFGRLCLKGVSPSLVNNGQEPFWSVNEVKGALNGGNPNVGFYSILTTSGEEANLIPQMSYDGSPWRLIEKQVYYEFSCVTEMEMTPLVVRVDAETFNHECLALAQDLSRAYVHCPQRAWDVKFSVSRINMGRITKDFEEFAATLVRSLGIKTNDIGEIEIDAEPDSASEWRIDRVSIHHVAKYQNNRKRPSCLTISMTRLVEKSSAVPRGRFRGQSVPALPPGKGRLGRWFEASISSVQATGLLQENAGLEFGEKTCWTPETLEKRGVLTAICEPALRMVSQMDPVGESNENQCGPGIGQGYNAVQDASERERMNPYW
ncbi:hypothetical protein FHETE_11095 [Fusarium heterosporum]|uniref:Uncharacterized protein n=1 Tax=Fusarium heterosporum TaxID=42747 RepID=A0A8H5SM47_FUSHE|nr:hypothetical protein FHETE_11095 [Fusarium heterosporum]